MIEVREQKPAWISHVEQLVNNALRMDEETLHRLTELSGKIIAFEFENMQLNVFLSPGDNGLTFESVCEDKPDVSIKGTPLNFIVMFMSSKQNANALPSDLQVTGDIGLAQRFQNIMQEIEIDLEEPLSKWVGDTAAYKLGKLFKNSRDYMFNTGKTLAMDLSEYLRFENQMLPDDLLVEEFCQEVEVLREDVDRLSQCVSRLADKVNSDDKVSN